jgi:hypothetical protein
MKRVLGPLIATVVGLAMLVVGIVGVAGAFDSKDSSSSGSSTADVANFDSCPTADHRFSEFKTFPLIGDAGDATAVVTCQDGNVEISVLGTGLTTEKPRTVALWLYNNRKDAELIASSQQDSSQGFLGVSGELPLASLNYEKLVVTEGPPSDSSEDPTEPGRVILKAKL